MARKTFLKTWLIISLLLPGMVGTAAGKTIYVDDDANGANNGTSWADAFNYLQDALAAGDPCDQIWVAEGIYTPDANSADPNGTGSRTATFQLINGVGLYGGFANGESSLGERDWENNITILSGDLSGDDIDFTNNVENSLHVVTGSGTDPNAILDGFTITAGSANWGSLPNNAGGGMYNNSGSPTIINCTFSGNSAHDYGAGMYNENGSNPMVTSCAFRGNKALAGGGMYNYQCNPIVISCAFSWNEAVSSGGGITNTFSSPILVNCTFNDNWAGVDGGGIFNYRGSPTITNCIFSRNIASGDGGGMYNYYTSPMITNCTFTRNCANCAGGMYNCCSSSPILTNCILWRDSSPTGLKEIYNDSSTATVTYSNVEGGYTGTGNINTHPLFVDADGPDDIPGTEDDNLRLSAGSPCIDAGDNTALPLDTADLDGDGNTSEPIPFDIDNDVRISDGVVDMGSDEMIWDSDDDVDTGEEVYLNPGGGSGTDPNEDALVVFENVSGPDNATIEVTEVGTDLHPDGLFRALGRTIRIDTTLADGEFFMTVSIPFDANDLAGEDPFGVDLFYWEEPPGKWQHAVKGNTDPQESNPNGNRWQEECPPTSAPSLADLKARGMGANGVFWNSQTQQGFVWANVDHTTDFAGLVAYNIAGDFEPDGDVDFADFAIFANNWLKGTE